MKAMQSVLLLSAAAMIGCSGPTEAPVEERPAVPNPEAIHEFVRESPLPDKQEVVITRVTPDEDVWIFRLRFGPPIDCLTGCGYVQAEGLANGAQLLIDNAVVRGDCELLRALAALPPHPDYVAVAAEAQALLLNCGA
jgi:hypothetical protein